jgi:hypothetical protein
MALPTVDTPLYNHPLPEIESWLRSQDCQQDQTELHHWHVDKVAWKADLWLDVDQLTVVYLGAGVDGQDIQRSFKYSLSRQDVEKAVFSGP